MQPDAGAEVDAGLALAHGIEGRDGIDALLQLQRGGDAVLRLLVIAEGILGVGVKVDEARRHHQAFGVDGPRAFQRAVGDRRDPSRAHADIGDAVGAGLRVHDPAVEDDQIVGRRRCRRRAGGEQQGAAGHQAPDRAAHRVLPYSRPSA